MEVYIVDTRQRPFIISKVREEERVDTDLKCVDTHGNKLTVFKGNYFKTYKEAHDKLQEIIFIGHYKSRKKYWKNNTWKCGYCGKTMYAKDEVTVDHIRPKSKGGKTTDSNLIICCKRCNGLKSSKHKHHYEKLLDINSKKKLQSPSKLGKKIRYSAHTKHGGNMEHIARMDGRYISVNSLSNYTNIVDRALEKDKMKKENLKKSKLNVTTD